mgnify:CR=1 FL=1
MTAPPAAPLRTALPLRFGDRASFGALRSLLQSAGYDEAAVCERTGAGSIYDFTSLAEGRERSEVADARDVLIRLFLDGEVVEAALAERHLGADGVRLLHAFGLIAERDGAPAACFGTVLLYPTRGLWVVSDLPSVAAGATKPLPSDAVYPAITDNTRDYLAAIPESSCERFLEMCGGTGIAALVAARHAGRAWTADITERATRFAEFNALLNDIQNFTAVQGDLYEPVRGLTFDRIAAHPPYVASAERTMIYRDGGPDGEQFTRALLAGLPEFLAPGGRFYMTCIATDRTNAPLEDRVREMIGPAHAAFDVAIAVRVAHDPANYYLSLARNGKASFAEAERRIGQYAEMQAERLVYASMVVERHASARLPVTARRSAGLAPLGEMLDWQLAWERLRESPQFTERLLAARVRCAERLRIRSSQRLEGASWLVDRCDAVTEWPFRASIECSGETAVILMRCDGSLTVGDLARALVSDGLLSADGADEAMASLIGFFVGAGCLESDLLPFVGRDA